MKKLMWFLPFLVSILTVTSLWAANAERLNPGQMLFPLAFAIPIAGIWLLLFWLLKWTSRTAPLVASFFTLFFLIWYGVPLWITVILLASALVLGIWKKLYPVTLKSSVILNLILLATIPVTLIQGAVMHVGDQDQVVQSHPVPGQPNIYFIVPDRMPSPAAMWESGIDSEEAVQDLQGMGFYVPDDMQSLDPYVAGMGGSFYVGTREVKIHTTRTMRFFASVLNDGEAVPLGISYAAARYMIKQPMVFDQLHAQGYQITNLASWFNETAVFPTADFNLRFQDVTLYERLFYDELSMTYYNRTLVSRLNFRSFQTDATTASVESARHNWQRDQILRMAASGNSSQFVMAHIMLPHEPFIYTDAKDPMDQYRDQIRYALRYLTGLAYGIHYFDPTAIILIQSDEGMAFRKPPELNYGLSPTQWNGVFTAWYIPMDETCPCTDPLVLSSISHTEILDMVLKSH